MAAQATHAVTGAFGYSGRHIAGLLLEAGHRVVTLTNSPHKPNPFGDEIAIRPLAFEDPDTLTRSLEGVEVLYNTYWVRFNHRLFSHSGAVQNSIALFDAARKAGVGRIVHVSITNPDKSSPLEYFHGKAVLERALQDTGVPHTILRPAVLFGGRDILVNNIAWTLRRSPVFGIFGDGSYRLQPIYVEDFARLAVEQGQATGNAIIDAIGPETFTFRELVLGIGDAIGKRRVMLPLPPLAAYAVTRAVGVLMRDVMLTWDEVKGLMGNCLYVNSPPAGETKLTEWAREHADSLGVHYASELARRRK